MYRYSAADLLSARLGTIATFYFCPVAFVCLFCLDPCDEFSFILFILFTVILALA